jgi:hypothetical protein
MKTQITILTCLLLFPLCSFGQYLTVQADPGIRVDQATTREALYRNDTIFLYFGDLLWNGTPGTSSGGLAISTDAPDFNTFTKVDIQDYPLYNFQLMPDGITRKRYIKGMANNYLQSQSSTNWWTFALDTGIRYYLPPSDNGTYGVSTVVVDSNNGVHIYYIGDMMGENNIRHCLSTDGGNNFAYQTNNICGDLGGAPGNYSHLDPFALRLDNDNIRLLTTNGNGTTVPPNSTFPSNWTVHSFISTDNGITFTQETTSLGNDTIISASMFLDTLVKSLHDPKAVQLPDGRIKIFVNGSTFDSNDSLHWDIYSATSLAALNATKNINSFQPVFYPNPTTGLVFIQATEAVNIQIFDLYGTLVKDRFRPSNFIDLSDLEAGIYIIRLSTLSGEQISKKLIKN